MAFLDRSSVLALVDPKGSIARDAFRYPENAKCCRYGRARDALTDDVSDSTSEVDLSSYILGDEEHAEVYLALKFMPGPKNLSKGFVYGSDPNTCDVLLAKDKTSGISGNHFSINVDWCTQCPIITCLAPNDGAGISILSGNVWSSKLQLESQVVEYGTAVTIRIFKNMGFVIHAPPLDTREPTYRQNLMEHFERCRDAIPDMTHLRLGAAELTPLLVNDSRGLTGAEYLLTNTIVGKRIVLCVAKSRQGSPVDPQTFIIKRFLYIRETWANHARTIQSQVRSLQHVSLSIILRA